ncbi:MAG: preprotein translocase subunit YajC [Microthrixaceae bacterium]
MTLELLAQDSGGGSPFGLIILLLPIAAIIFLTVVPQRRQKAKQAALMKNLEVGDDVVSIGGIHGVINHIEDDVVHLEVDDDVVMKFGLGAISRKSDEPDPNSPEGRRSGGFLSSLMGGGQAGAGATDSDSDAEVDISDSGDDSGAGDGADKGDKSGNGKN